MSKEPSQFEFVVLPMIFIGIFALCFIIFSRYGCYAKWERAEMSGISWGPIQGCMVQLPDGRWVPEERVRVIEVSRIDGKS